MVTPSSFKPHLQSRQRKIFYEAHKETVFCVKDNLFLELVDGGPPKFSSVEMSDFENKMMTTPDKTSESSFETVKLNSLENFWLELGNIDQKGNSSGIPGIFIIQTRKGESSEWESLRPEGNQTFYFDTPISFNPTIGYSGEFQVSVILKTYDFFGSSVVVDTSHLYFMMKVNYAPSARRNPHFDQLPTLTVNETDQGRPVVEYTDPLYEHSTLRSLGMIVFHAHSSHLGEWEARIHKKGGQWEPLFIRHHLKSLGMT
ncbi:uncharacterized protein LOC143245372 [Tachypleus tridentatus]|uniref:uncharacterized protein LOC143245372 n=1 Tax=Tachypleus tridentatus TaxID=6853 RepID=UPI003FCEF202